MVEIATGQLWQHYKGNVYEILALGILEATGEDAVIYRMPHTEVNWVRPRLDFLGKVRIKDERGNPKLIPRFSRLEIPEETTEEEYGQPCELCRFDKPDEP